MNKITLIQIISDGGIGGGPSHVFGLLKNINKAEFDCYLICPSGNLSDKTKKLENVILINLEMKSKFGLNESYKLKSHIDRIKSNKTIIHIHGPRALMLARKSINSDIKIIYTEHIYTKDYYLRNKINDFLQKKIIKFLYTKLDLIIAVSNEVKKYLISVGVEKDKVVIIPNGFEKIDEKYLPNESLIGTIGSLNYLKGHKYLIDAMPLILQNYNNIILEIVSSGDEEIKLKNQVSKLHLEKSIKFYGAQENIGKFLSRWRIFILPSLSESFGIVLMEAMSVGVPSIATKVGGIIDFAIDNQNCLLIEKQNPQQIADAIVNLLEDKKLSDELGQNGKITSDKYQWGKIIKEIEKTYLALVE